MHWLVTGLYGEQADAGCAAVAGLSAASTLYRRERLMLIGITICDAAVQPGWCLGLQCITRGLRKKEIENAHLFVSFFPS